MDEETSISESHDEDAPQVFAVSKDAGGAWKFNRRDFVKTAGAVAAAGTLAGCSSEPEMRPTRLPTGTPDLVSFAPSSSGVAHDGNVLALLFHPDGKLLASGGSDATRLWSLPDGALLKTVDGWTDTLAIGSNGNLLVSGNRPVKVSSIVEESSVKEIDGFHFIVSSDESLLVVVGVERTALYSLPEVTLVKNLGDTNPAIAVSPD
ncbi:WD40 repeat domain-containing protein [Aggregatilinea lenta]|uniref:WD40 repeat domain-containing protein n=1 Tax=Aggregatilinea lenta TaxID=913108 RepID=UPI000E5AEB86|nr:twin-arginine translocation signal domain-containing protein [Aggregatilinea lenta]